MKKVAFFFCCLWFVFNSVVLAEERLKVSVPPSIWAKVQNQKLTGPIIDLVSEIFDEFDISIETAVLPWARSLIHMKTGELDMIPVIFFSKERSDYMAFSIPYIDVPTSIFVPQGSTFIYNGLNDLEGKDGLLVRGDSISQEFNDYKSKLRLTELPHYQHIVRMLGAKRADYAVAAKFGFLIQVKKMGYGNQIEALPTPVAKRQLHIAISKNSRFLKYMPAVNDKLLQLQKDGSLQRLTKKAIQLAAGN